MWYIETEETTQYDQYRAIVFVVLMLFALLCRQILDENVSYYEMKVETQAKQGVRSMIY